MEPVGGTQPETPDPCDCLVPTTLAIRGSGRGPLRGSTFVAKDLFAVEGHTSSFGHAGWRDTHSPSTTTAPAIRDLLVAGADLVGMTKLDQLAYSLIGDVGEGNPPLNSADPSLYCGGSSSGSAAAVAAGLVDFALGTDTAGSIRVPAAACGLLSIRPTHGSIPSDGVVPLAPSFDVVGLFATSVATLTDALAVISPSLHGRPSPVRLRFATDLFALVDRESARIGREVAEQVAACMEIPLEETTFLSFTDAAAGDLLARLQSREIWELHAEWVEANAGALADDVRRRLERCRQMSQDPDRVQLADRTTRQEFRDRFREAVQPGTIVMLPILPDHGPKRTWSAEELADFRTGCVRLTAPASLTGAPQAVWSVRGAAERSVGIGLLTAPGDDRALLDVMSRLSEGSAKVRD